MISGKLRVGMSLSPVMDEVQSQTEVVVSMATARLSQAINPTSGLNIDPFY